MKKLFITGVLLCSAIILIGAQTGFAWQNYNGGCQDCHGTGFAALNNHATHSALSCTACHVASGDVPATSKCVVCHPAQGDKGLCPLISAHGNPSSCLACHTACAPATTTTTAPTSTTTTVPAGCITIEPNEVEVSGPDKTLDVTVTFTRTDVISLPEEDLNKLVIEVDDSCAQYITVNSSTINIGETAVTAIVNITVEGTAPSSQCSIKVSDPEGVAEPPLNCEATFTITQIPTSECSIVSVESTVLPLRAGLLPAPRRIIIKGSGSNWDRTSAVSIEDIRLVIPLRVQATQINALIVIPSTLSGFEPGTKAVGVATGNEVCTGTVTIQ